MRVLTIRHRPQMLLGSPPDAKSYSGQKKGEEIDYVDLN